MINTTHDEEFTGREGDPYFLSATSGDIFRKLTTHTFPLAPAGPGNSRTRTTRFLASGIALVQRLTKKFLWGNFSFLSKLFVSPALECSGSFPDSRQKHSRVEGVWLITLIHLIRATPIRARFEPGFTISGSDRSPIWPPFLNNPKSTLFWQSGELKRLHRRVFQADLIPGWVFC